MFNGNVVIDADGHVMEPNELYDEYPGFLDLAVKIGKVATVLIAIALVHTR
jgi:hypothetical protein